jgi:hypothetical protein
MTIPELCDRAEFDEETRALAAPDMPVRPYVEQLAAAGRLREAAGALAHLLPKKEAIAWGLESIRRVPAASEKRGAEDTMKAVEDWLGGADDAKRRAAVQAAEQAGIGTPAGCLGLAVFLSGGSIAPPDTPVAPEAEPHLSAKMVAGAMSMAVALDPQNALKHFRSFVDRGFQIASESNIWEEK